MSDSYRYRAMQCTLGAAVPMWIHHWLRRRAAGADWEEMRAKLDELGEILGRPGYGEALVSGGAREGMTAEAFNAVAEAIAVLSFCPGGITIFGDTWDARVWARHLGQEIDDDEFSSCGETLREWDDRFGTVAQAGGRAGVDPGVNNGTAPL